MAELMPALFLGHGNPMNAVLDNEYAAAWSALGKQLPRPRAVLSISAHWYVPKVAVTAMPAPRTLHDFGGFPAELFAVQYPAPGSPTLAAEIQSLLAPLAVELDQEWGLDHGTWSVLKHVFPKADVPVLQLSIDATRPPAFHYELGQRLRPLRDAGVLILGSGDIVHNLRTYAWGREGVPAFDWAERFEHTVLELIEKGEHAPLVAYETLGRDASLAVPTPDHYLPLLYLLGAALPGERVTFPVQGIEGGSVSMTSVRMG